MNFKKKAEGQLRKIFSSGNKIEVVKMQENLIRNLEKFGYPYQEDFTLKEYLASVGEKRADLKSDLDMLTDKLYYARYSLYDISNENIAEYKKLIAEVLNKF